MERKSQEEVREALILRTNEAKGMVEEVLRSFPWMKNFFDSLEGAVEQADIGWESITDMEDLSRRRGMKAAAINVKNMLYTAALLEVQAKNQTSQDGSKGSGERPKGERKQPSNDCEG